MGNSIEKLASAKPTEIAGPRSSNRFDYQINWGLKKLIELESNDEDYIMILDYHDDIVICNSEKQDDFIDFYQVKTRTQGYWNLAALKGSASKDEDGENIEGDRVKKDNLSILSKLIRHTLNFDSTRSLYFVTNTRLSPNVSPKGYEFIPFNQLSDESKKNIKDAVHSELGDFDDEAFEKLTFIQNQMNVNDYQHTMLGALSKFLKDKFDTVTDYPVVYDNIISMMRDRNNYEPEINDSAELLRCKSITHQEFRTYIQGVTQLQSFDDIVSRIQTEINGFVSYSERLEINKNLKLLKSAILNYESEESSTLIPLIETLYIDVPTDDVNNLWDHTCKIYEYIIPKYVNYKNHSEGYIKSAILYVAEKQT